MDRELCSSLKCRPKMHVLMTAVSQSDSAFIFDGPPFRDRSDGIPYHRLVAGSEQLRLCGSAESPATQFFVTHVMGR